MIIYHWDLKGGTLRYVGIGWFYALLMDFLIGT